LLPLLHQDEDSDQNIQDLLLLHPENLTWEETPGVREFRGDYRLHSSSHSSTSRDG
jgi:hypothetical protein